MIMMNLWRSSIKISKSLLESISLLHQKEVKKSKSLWMEKMLIVKNVFIQQDILLINHILKLIQIGTLKRKLLFIRKVIQYSLNSK